MVKISACVITKNEADNLARCLQSVKNIVNEIIVVDTGSSDDTVKIAEELGAKVFHFAWVNNFAAARNHALAQAKGDWIIFLDADEYIVADKAPNLRPILDKIHGNRKIEALSCTMEHTEGFGGALKARDRTVRIFRNSPTIRYKGKVHEFIYKNDRLTQSAHLTESVIIIRHTGYAKEKRPEKLIRNHRLLEETIKEGGADGLTYYYLGHSFWAVRQYDKAAEFAQKALRSDLVTSSMFAHRVYCILIESMLHLDAYGQDDVRPLVAEVMQKYSHHPEVLKCQAYYQRRFGYYTQALDTLQKSLAANKCYNDISLANEFLINISRVHAEIAELYDLMNDSVKTLEHYVTALKIKKDEQRAFDGLVSLIRPQKATDIILLINSLYDLEAEADVSFLVNRLAALQVKQVFGYYEKIWAQRFNHKDFTAMKFLLSGLYAQSIPLFAASFREFGDQEAELLVAVAALLDDLPQGAESLGPQLEPAFRKINFAFSQPEAGRFLTPEDFPVYLALVKNALHIASDPLLLRLLSISLMFPIDNAPEQIAAILTKQRFYRPALELFCHQMERTDAGQAGGLYCRAGFCCYKLKEYEAAADFFAQARECGFTGHEAVEYLTWSYQQCQDAEIRNKVGAVLAQYDARDTKEKQ